MKMYTQDYAWEGAIVIIADDRDHLQRILNQLQFHGKYGDAVMFDEREIVSGLVVTFEGDT